MKQAERKGNYSSPERGREKPRKAYLTDAIAYFVGRWPVPIVIVSTVATLFSIFMCTRYTPDILETNLSRLRNRHSIESGSAFMSKHLDEIFQRYLSPMVILPKTSEETEQVATLLKKIKKDAGSKSLIASVQTMDDFVPPQQQEKIKVLKQIRQLLPPKFFYRLSDQDQAKVTEFLTDASLTPFGKGQLPHLVLNKFTEKDGTIGKLVLVEPPLTNETWEGDNVITLVKTLRDAADTIRPGTAVAGTLAITSDMIESISHDGPKATLFAFLAVVILVVVLFRNLSSIGLTLFALIMGIIWLAGLILGFGFKINFLNFIALPITFGIGVDYGVNMFQRYQEEKSEGILKVIRTTGGAVGLCSFSTVVGYLSLLIASNQGFVSFGILAVAGELTSVGAAIFSLPAFILVTQRLRARSIPQKSTAG